MYTNPPTHTHTHTHLDSQLVGIILRGVIDHSECDYRWQRYIARGARRHPKRRPRPVVLGGVAGLGTGQDLNLILLAGMKVSDLKLVEVC